MLVSEGCLGFIQLLENEPWMAENEIKKKKQNQREFGPYVMRQ